ncbi:hypothetical protein AYI68_g2833 [Smittium mucronatum]|uniref:Uncharacterized protein n=1 Tax=Smittium mucronatum TaxID=133383 RepID=A0A1R0H1L9_9FUNG|nr:hypothetical protein AYI68_g2833 [Smittium mucronatum]
MDYNPYSNESDSNFYRTGSGPKRNQPNVIDHQNSAYIHPFSSATNLNEIQLSPITPIPVEQHNPRNSALFDPYQDKSDQWSRDLKRPLILKSVSQADPNINSSFYSARQDFTLFFYFKKEPPLSQNANNQ